MKHASLFSGIGGFDLAAQWMGWENVFYCEINEFCQQVLKKHFPNSIAYHDIKETNFTIHRGAVDILTGGFPCQPYSIAGKRKGKEDERHLWPEMLRAIREIQPRYIVGENVGGIVNWNNGLVFDEVQAEMENEGYEILPIILPACALNAPHRRDRIWFIAHTTRNISNNEFGNEGQETRSLSEKRFVEPLATANPNLAPTDHSIQARGNMLTGSYWQGFPTQSPICGRNDGVSDRVDRIKALGNAIVPQVAFEIFKAIQKTL